jgi:hypothetical protein
MLRKPGWQWLIPWRRAAHQPAQEQEQAQAQEQAQEQAQQEQQQEHLRSRSRSPSLRRVRLRLSRTKVLLLAQTRNALVLAAGERRGAVLESLKETMSARRTPRLGDDGPFREPDRSSARNDGWARAVAAGELLEPEDEARAYLEAEPGKLGVFRCPDCEVRVAQEADLCRRPSLAQGVLTAATFTRIYERRRR